jgi:hypothetical protein
VALGTLGTRTLAGKWDDLVDSCGHMPILSGVSTSGSWSATTPDDSAGVGLCSFCSEFVVVFRVGLQYPPFFKLNSTGESGRLSRKTCSWG